MEARARLILGTAGHIDHGKTALVRALTGIDTDRLKEEKERGITVDLGFAELALSEHLRYGVVDVPGHEGFIRNMVAGATGMDVVLLVVAADEGVMPQTREHLAIVQLLNVHSMVVALTKADLVEDEWLELVAAEVAELLEGTPQAGAPVVATSSETGHGLDELRATLARVGGDSRLRSEGDLARLPVDRVFTVRGTGTVATGTLWSGTLSVEDQVRILPGDVKARVRGLEVHGVPADTARAGERTAVALTGTDVSRDALGRGQALVKGPGWQETWMLTTLLRVLEGPGWPVERGQRVRVHLGTAEVMARAAVLEDARLAPGEEGWVQLRLEEPVVARARDRLIVRSYSPVTTIAGGVVAEAFPAKRNRLSTSEAEALRVILDGDPGQRLDAVVGLAGWEGVSVPCLPVVSGDSPDAVGLARGERDGIRVAGDRWFAPSVAVAGRQRLRREVAEYHGMHPLRPGMPLEELRQRLPGSQGAPLAEALLRELSDEGALEIREGVALDAGFEPALSDSQAKALERLRGLYREAGLSPPVVRELPRELRDDPALRPLLAMLERDGSLVAIDEDLFIDGAALAAAVARVRKTMAGRGGLGPADFREALPVTRKHLIPLLAHLDGLGVTVRGESGRTVMKC